MYKECSPGCGGDKQDHRGPIGVFISSRLLSKGRHPHRSHNRRRDLDPPGQPGDHSRTVCRYPSRSPWTGRHRYRFRILNRLPGQRLRSYQPLLSPGLVSEFRSIVVISSSLIKKDITPGHPAGCVNIILKGRNTNLNGGNDIFRC